MLTALPYRFHFEAVCLAGFRVPAGKPDSQKAEAGINSNVICGMVFTEVAINVSY
jgi:hypothetical protein